MRHRHRSLTPRFLAASVLGLLALAALDVALAGQSERRAPAGVHAPQRP